MYGNIKYKIIRYTLMYGIIKYNKIHQLDECNVLNFN